MSDPQVGRDPERRQPQRLQPLGQPLERAVEVLSRVARRMGILTSPAA